MDSGDVEAVQVYKDLVEGLLDRAAQIKPDRQIEPPLTEAVFGDPIWQLPPQQEAGLKSLNQQTRFAAVEIAFREKFYHTLASTTIHDPSFIHIWNLLDIVSIFSDNEQCEPGLIFWLIEELLDSQTINGCRKVFDYLESRRERNIKKHFKQKNLIILRSCNELLRRLSRAEDTVFCGRVFIFLFQSFPLGDKSSVNLRGEFHTENVTNFDEISKTNGADADEDINMAEDSEDPNTAAGTPENTNKDEDGALSERSGSRVPKVVISGGRQDKTEEPMDLDVLYPIFWNLQSFFSSPSKMFDAERFASFRSGLEATLKAFRSIKTDIESKAPSRSSDEAHKSQKRKRTADEGEIGTSFNPKYLTSRDLFDLEVSDTAFRRHVLVQALILLDFMLSLTSKAKTRHTDLTNKSVLYGFTLSDEDAKWVASMRKSIEGYLQDGPGGKFYYRMVDTVLSRDRNWVRWKAEGCPPIERPAITVPDYMKARNEASKSYANKRLRPTPMGSLDLKFLSDAEALTNIERLKETDRFTVPTPDSYLMSIMDDELDIDMPATPDDKEAAIRSKSSKTWRILRLASKSKLSAFDKISDGQNLKALFETTEAPTESVEATEANEDGEAADDAADTEGNETVKDVEVVEGVVEGAEAAQSVEGAEGAEQDLQNPVTDTETVQESTEAPDAPEAPTAQEAQETPTETVQIPEDPQALGATGEVNPVTEQGSDAPDATPGDDKTMEDSTT